MSAKREYGVAILAVLVSTAVSFAIFPHLPVINLVMVYLLGTTAVAARGHRGPAIVACLISVLCFDYFFVPPRFTFNVSDVEYLFTFLVMFVVAILISHLTIRLRSEAEAARGSERQTALMHEFSQGLTRAQNVRDVFAAATPALERTFHATVAVHAPRFDLPVTLNEKERGVAQWVYDKGKPAGLGAASLPSEPALYVPIRGAAGALGVLRVEPASHEPLPPSHRQLLDAFGHQMALAIEANEAFVEVETERLRSSLLSSVSHDFRTPLTAIVGSAGALLAKPDVQSNAKVSELVETIQDEAERLSRQIENLLEVTKLESGRLLVRKERYPLEEVIGNALERLKKPLKDLVVNVNVDPDLPAVPLDGLLFEQVLVNLIENALRHAPSSPDISITALKSGPDVKIVVSDRGPGIKEDARERIFEKFYRQPSSTGAGLGLAICRAIVAAHSGKIWADNDPNGGAVFNVTVPLENFHD